MTQGRLNGIASFYTHKDIHVPIKDVIDKFARTSRRISMANIIESERHAEEHDGSFTSDVY